MNAIWDDSGLVFPFFIGVFSCLDIFWNTDMIETLEFYFEMKQNKCKNWKYTWLQIVVVGVVERLVKVQKHSYGYFFLKLFMQWISVMGTWYLILVLVPSIRIQNGRHRFVNIVFLWPCSRGSQPLAHAWVLQ